jgi:hypothetical protein
MVAWGVAGKLWDAQADKNKLTNKKKIKVRRIF